MRRPLLPLRVVLNRRRGGSYLAVLGLAVGMFAALFFLTFYLQNVLGYSPGPGRAGLPAAHRRADRSASARSSRLLAPGPGAGAALPGPAHHRRRAGLLGRFRSAAATALHVLPVFLLVGLGTGWVLVTANSTATLERRGRTPRWPARSVMTSQQIGASLGTALLGTIAGTAAARYLHATPAAGRPGGASTASTWPASRAAAASSASSPLAVYLVAGPRKPIASA